MPPLKAVMSCWKWLCPCSNVLLGPVVFSTVSSRTLATRHSPAVSLRGKFNKKNLPWPPQSISQENASGV